MRRIASTVLCALLIIAGLAAFILAVAAFTRAVPADVGVSLYNLAQWFPWYGFVGLLAAIVGVIFLTNRRQY